MTKSARPVFLVLIVALFALTALATTATRSSARTYAHGKTVWFGTQTIGADDYVNGDLNIVMGDVTCEDGGVIRGDVHNYGGYFTQLDGCQIGGDVQQLGPGSLGTLLPWPDFDASNRALMQQNEHVFRHLAWGVLVLFAFLLFPMRVRVALERVERHPGLAAVTGTVAAVAVIPLAILLLLSVIGIPLIVVEVAALLACLWIGQGAVAILIGRRLSELLRPHTTPSPLGALMLGLIVVIAAEMLPGFGWVVMLLVGLVGLGAAILGFTPPTFPHVGPPPPAVGTSPMRTA
jgi:hypothetical protein